MNRARAPHATQVRALSGALGVAVGVGLGAVFGAFSLGACRVSTQRWPAPMNVPPMPEEQVTVPGASSVDVLVVRYSDPVLIRKAAANSGYPLAFYNKKERLRSGDWVLTGAGGRADLSWSGVTSAVVLYDDNVVRIGEPSIDEPLISFSYLTHCRIRLVPDDVVVLEGGAQLRGDPEFPSGPFTIERVRPSILQLVNQSKAPARVAYRELTLEIGPGELVNLPLLELGTGPLAKDPTAMPFSQGLIDVTVLGEVEQVDSDDRIQLRSIEPSLVEALGVKVELEPGEEVSFGNPLPLEPEPLAPGPREAASGTPQPEVAPGG